MGNLREQLLKARLISEEKAQALKKEQRTKRNAQSIRVMEKDAEEKARLYRESLQKTADIERTRAKIRADEEDNRIRELRLCQIVESGKLTNNISGPNKFYFQAEEDRITCLELSSTAVEELRKGNAAIVELADRGQPRYYVVNRRVAEILGTEKPESVKFFNRTETS